MNLRIPASSASSSTAAHNGVERPGQAVVAEPAAPVQPAPAVVDAHESLPTLLDADLKIRTSSLAASGPTKTQVPNLLDDWRVAVVHAAAEGAAEAEMIPDAEPAVRAAEQQRGPLDQREVAAIIEAFFDAHRPRLDDLTATYLAELDRGPKEREQTIQRVIVEERPRVQQLRDPFTPVAQKDPAARAREVVLWENADAMVLVDLFAPSPKALVVPKQPVMLAIDAPKPLVDDLALLAAHVSDAFMETTGVPPAGIWVNPPQHLTVRQMHVHVLPALPDWLTFVGMPAQRPVRAVQAAQDPQVNAQMQAFFQQLTHALEQKLGPAT